MAEAAPGPAPAPPCLVPAKVRRGRHAAMTAPKDMGGESPRTAALFPSDAPIEHTHAFVRFSTVAASR